MSSCVIDSLKPSHKYPARIAEVRAASSRLVRNDNLHLSKYVRFYKKKPDDVDAIISANKVSEEKKIKQFVRSMSPLKPKQNSLKALYRIASVK